MSPYSRSQKSKKNKDKGLIIFDFDGVLADSFDMFYNLVKDSMAEIGKPISKKGYRDLFRTNVHKGFEKFINNSEKYLFFRKIRELNYDKYYKEYDPKLFDGAIDFIKKLEKNFILTIASSGRKSNIIGLLRRNGIHSHFDLILATSQSSKESMIKEILSEHKADPEKTAMITDTVGDIKIAKHMRLIPIGVEWGFHSRRTLKSAGPKYIAKTFKDLAKILN